MREYSSHTTRPACLVPSTEHESEEVVLRNMTTELIAARPLHDLIKTHKTVVAHLHTELGKAGKNTHKVDEEGVFAKCEKLIKGRWLANVECIRCKFVISVPNIKFDSELICLPPTSCLLPLKPLHACNGMFLSGSPAQYILLLGTEPHFNPPGGITTPSPPSSSPPKHD